MINFILEALHFSHFLKAFSSWDKYQFIETLKALKIFPAATAQRRGSAGGRYRPAKPPQRMNEQKSKRKKED